MTGICKITYTGPNGNKDISSIKAESEEQCTELVKQAKEAGHEDATGSFTPPAVAEGPERKQEEVVAPPKAGTSGAAASQPASAPAPKPTTTPEPAKAERKSVTKRPEKKGELEKIITAAVKVANRGIKVKVTNELVIDDRYIQRASRGETRQVRQALAKRKDKVQLTEVLENLDLALSNTINSKYDLIVIQTILKTGWLSLDFLAKFKGLSGDKLIEALLRELGLDLSNFEKALSGLKELLKDPNVTLETIQNNPAYKTYAKNPDQLSPENRGVIEAAKAKVADLERKEAIEKPKREARAAIRSATTLDQLKAVWQVHQKTINQDRDLFTAFGTRGQDIVAGRISPTSPESHEDQKEEAYAILSRSARKPIPRAEFDKVWKDGKIDKDAAKKLFADYFGNEKLYILVSNSMNANATEGGDLDLAKLREYEKVIKFWAEQLKMKESEIANAFIESKSFCMVDRKEVVETSSALKGKLNGVTLGNIGERLKDYTPRVIDAVKAHFAGKDLSDELVAAYLMRLSLASLTERPDLFGVKESVVKEMPSLRGVGFSRDKIAAWFSGRTVTEQPAPKYGSGGGETEATEYDQRYFDKQKEFADIRKSKNPYDRRRAAYGYMGTISNDLRKLESFWKLTTINVPGNPRSRYIEGLDTTPEAVQIMYKAYTATRDPNQYAKALELIEKLPDGKEKQQLLAKLAVDYLQLRTSPEDRQKAVRILERIATMRGNQSFISGSEEDRPIISLFTSFGVQAEKDGTVSVQTLLNAIKREVKRDVALLRYEEELIQKADEQEEAKKGITHRFRLKEGKREAAVSALNQLTKYIASAQDPSKKAYARYLRGLIFYGLALQLNDLKASVLTVNGKTVSARMLYEQAIYEMRMAYDLVAQQGENDETRYLRTLFLQGMGTILDIALHDAPLSGGEQRKFVKELALFLPTHTSTLIKYQPKAFSKDARQPDQFDPKDLRKFFKASQTEDRLSAKAKKKYEPPIALSSDQISLHKPEDDEKQGVLKEINYWRKLAQNKKVADIEKKLQTLEDELMKNRKNAKEAKAELENIKNEAKNKGITPPAAPQLSPAEKAKRALLTDLRGLKEKAKDKPAIKKDIETVESDLKSGKIKAEEARNRITGIRSRLAPPK